MANMIVLTNILNDKDIVVYNNYLMHDDDFIELSDDFSVEVFLDRHEVTPTVWQKVLNAVETGEGDDVEFNESVAQFANKYTTEVALDPVVRQIIINSKDVELAIDYCVVDATFNYEKYEQGGFDKEVRQIILDSKNAKIAYRYCEEVYMDNNMYQLVLDAKDPKLAERFCKYIKNTQEMSEVANNV